MSTTANTRDLLPRPIALTLRAVYRHITDSGAVSLRNRYIGHIKDKASGTPLTPTEINAAFIAVAGEDPTQFLDWVLPVGAELPATCVVGVLEEVRASLIDLFHELSGEAKGGS
jgi:hypothetical protein